MSARNRRRVREVRAILNEKYPTVFVAKGEPMADADDLRFMAFADGVSCLVRESAKDAAVALTAELNAAKAEADKERG